jgi:hypothetical protein
METAKSANRTTDEPEMKVSELRDAADWGDLIEDMQEIQIGPTPSITPSLSMTGGKVR